MLSNDERRWQVLLERQQVADPPFIYAVKTTGIYCRPGCASRLPKRDNVSFFSNVQAAREAGFRPCKRCQPDDEGVDKNAALIKTACRFLDEAEAPISLKLLAETIGLSAHHFHRLFKAKVGITPRQYLAERRRQRLQTTLHHSGSVTVSLIDAGFNSSSRFYEHTDNLLGMTPSQFKKRAAGLTIRFSIIAQPVLGFILVAVTERGICSIDIGNDPEQLQQSIIERFANATLSENDPLLSEWITQILNLIKHPGQPSNLPLDIIGTAFQQQVWEILRRIPAGETATYSQIAEVLGKPKAVRAVAKACASNNLAIAIPCHRVIKKNGDLSGYRWGIDRKRLLLEQESDIKS